jgi:hypothetical protein
MARQKTLNPDIVARTVSYEPDLSTLPLIKPFRARWEKRQVQQRKLFTQALIGTGLIPDSGRVFHVGNFATPLGTVTAQQPGLVMRESEDKDTFAVVLPVREKQTGAERSSLLNAAKAAFLGGTTFLTTEITLPPEIAADPTRRDDTMAIALAVTELRQGNIYNPGGGE